MEVEEELNKMLNEVEALKQSLPDSTKNAHILKLQKRVEHLANLAKSEPTNLSKPEPIQPIQQINGKELHAFKQSSRGNRGRSYSLREDEALCRAWLAIGENPANANANANANAVGLEQKSCTMWDRILQVFNSCMGRVTDRNVNGLQCRWQHIQWSITKFCEFVSEMDQLNPSGTALSDCGYGHGQGVSNMGTAQFLENPHNPGSPKSGTQESGEHNDNN